jgi:hypothetical protein
MVLATIEVQLKEGEEEPTPDLEDGAFLSFLLHSTNLFCLPVTSVPLRLPSRFFTHSFLFFSQASTSTSASCPSPTSTRIFKPTRSSVTSSMPGSTTTPLALSSESGLRRRSFERENDEVLWFVSPSLPLPKPPSPLLRSPPPFPSNLRFLPPFARLPYLVALSLIVSTDFSFPLFADEDSPFS